MGYNKRKVGTTKHEEKIMKISPSLGFLICSLAVGTGVIMICLSLGMLQSKALIAGLLAFMATHIATGWLYKRN